MTYLQNRYNSPLSDPDDCGGCFYLYTDLGLASTPDNGTTWIYRGVMQGLGAPGAWGDLARGMRQNGSAHGGATWWRPAVTYSAEDRQYHGFFAYLLQSRGESGPTTQEEFHVTHYTSHDLLNWEFRGFLPSGGKSLDFLDPPTPTWTGSRLRALANQERVPAFSLALRYRRLPHR